MTTATNTAFYSQRASPIFGYKQYPSGEEFMRVAMDITKKYPFLEALKERESKLVSRLLVVFNV